LESSSSIFSKISIRIIMESVSSSSSDSSLPETDDLGEWTPSDEAPIKVTDKALEAFKKALKEDGEEGEGLRISVQGGGCAGYNYNLDFEKEERMGDVVMELSGVRVFLDAVSLGYLRGTVVDYVKSLQGEGFKFSNPNAKRTCGCGSSFG
jgi:iron-sulfur cluster assembly accessory protein